VCLGLRLDLRHGQAVPLFAQFAVCAGVQTPDIWRSSMKTDFFSQKVASSVIKKRVSTISDMFSPDSKQGWVCGSVVSKKSIHVGRVNVLFLSGNQVLTDVRARCIEEKIRFCHD
jgi:hypothetical protein